MQCDPQKEHQWLQKFVGEWTYECEASMGPDQPPGMFTGTESVRSIGGLWVMGEGRGEMPGGGQMTAILTVGYDPAKKKYVGSWIGSMMMNMWVYEGDVDAAGKVLTLNTEGPTMTADCKPDGRMSKYRDVTEFKSNDHRVLTSWMQGEDGKWVSIMTATYRRKK